MTQGIYLLSFPGTPKLYVGQSINIENRYKGHLQDLYSKTHSKKMNEAYLKYGTPTLEIECICTGDMDEKENEFILFWNSVSDGFNTLSTANGGTSSGEDNGTSLYTDKQYVEIMEYIISNPNINLVKVSEALRVSYNVVKSMSLGITQKWMGLVYPDQYAKLMALKGTRNNRGENQGRATSSNTQLAEALLLQYKNPTMPYHEIGAIVGLSKEVVSDVCTRGYNWLEGIYPVEYNFVRNNRENKRSYSRSAAARGIAYPTIVSPSGELFNITNINAFAKLHGLDTGALNKVLNRKALSTKGWELQERKQTSSQELPYVTQ